MEILSKTATIAKHVHVTIPEHIFQIVETKGSPLAKKFFASIKTEPFVIAKQMEVYPRDGVTYGHFLFRVSKRQQMLFTAKQHPETKSWEMTWDF